MLKGARGFLPLPDPAPPFPPLLSRPEPHPKDLNHNLRVPPQLFLEPSSVEVAQSAEVVLGALGAILMIAGVGRAVLDDGLISSEGDVPFLSQLPLP